jgi:hypothetical protein
MADDCGLSGTNFQAIRFACNSRQDSRGDCQSSGACKARSMPCQDISIKTLPTVVSNQALNSGLGQPNKLDLYVESMSPVA